MAWVREHARELIEIAARFGARRVSLCGSVARGTDGETSDLDFFVWEFDQGAGPVERLDARRRADKLVDTLRDIAPYDVDVRGLPGWPVGPEQEATMRRDSVDLEGLTASES